MATAQLKPYAQEWLDTEAKLGGRSVLKGEVDEQRQQFAGLGAAIGPMMAPLPDVLDVSDHKAGSVPVRVYSPKEGKGDLPIGLYMHCGGFVMGSIDSDDYFCRVVAMSTPCVIVSVEYRLAPEHKYPAAQDDALAAFDWVTQNASKHGASPSKIFTIGQSAGGNMAIMVALKIAASSDPSRVKGVVALGPPTVNPNAIPAHLKDQFNFAENADSAIIDTDAMALYSSSYGAPADSPDVSVLLSKDLGKLPPTYLVVTDKDPTRDDGLVFEKEAKKAGVKIKMDFYEGFPHMFWLIPGMKEGDKWAGNLVEGLKWVVSNMGS